MSGERPPAIPVDMAAGLVLPVVSGLVFDAGRRHVLLQRRDKPGEPVRGLLELPGGRWMAGERPDVAVAREVAEETGVTVTAVAAAVTLGGSGESTATAVPVAVVNGIGDGFPSMHVLFECYAEGEPRPVAGETADPRWWPVEEVTALLEDDPGAFVAQTAAMLRAGLGRLTPPRGSRP